MKKISKRKKLVIALDKLFSLYIRGRGSNVCFTCGTTESPTCGHLRVLKGDEVDIHKHLIWCVERIKQTYVPGDIVDGIQKEKTKIRLFFKVNTKKYG